MRVKVFTGVPPEELEARLKEWIKSTPKFQFVQATQSQDPEGLITITVFYYPAVAGV